MKKIILLSLILSLTGCKEPNTEMDKTLFNTSYDKCVDYLTASLKSPSSLKIREVNISTVIPTAQDIKSVFGELITTNGLIRDQVKEDKARFRELMVDIEYEAHNSYGASIRGNYQCGFISRLNKDEKSPESLNTYLYKLISDGENVDLGIHIPIAKFTGSNLYLDNAIKSVIGAKDSQFNQIDTTRYNEIESIYFQEKQNIEAEKIRQSWNKSSSRVDQITSAAAAAADAVAAAYIKASRETEIAATEIAAPAGDPRLSDAAIASSGFPRD
ncbi:hypothetical protein [Acinetobacter dispersus]|uniref:Lipoprotein n=1 Tax=Acinetobacter dispersus TaxID=70348 RepID=N9LM37_9GAMM|nr:hypothetical protein [Acinetobacter dispersus]ENW97332.1 hypothetical protein F904_00170 [Acinetobacter dispersus]